MVAGIWKPDLGGLAGNLMPGLPTTMGDVYDAAYAEGLTGNSVLAPQFALEQAIDEKNDRIKAATGVALPNPTRAAVDYEKPQDGVDDDAARNWQAYRTQLGELRDRFPERFDILADFDENEIAKAQTRANDKRLGEVSAMGPGGGATFAASLAGGFVASLRDPPQLIANILAPGAGFGKSLLYHGVKSAAINAGVEAGIQPFVQSWRAEAGVESGLNEAMKDILMAGAAGGAIDVIGRGAFRAAKVYRGGKWVDDPAAPEAAAPGAAAIAPDADPAAPVARAAPADVDLALDDAAKRLPPEHPIRQAAEGRPEALVREVEKLGEQATPELRSLAHRAETETLFGPPDGMDEVRHIEGMAQAIRNAVAPEIEPPGFSGARSPELGRMVDGGLVPEDLAALVARSAPLERQADLAQLILDKSPATPDAARRILADELSKPVARVGDVMAALRDWLPFPKKSVLSFHGSAFARMDGKFDAGRIAEGEPGLFFTTDPWLASQYVRGGQFAPLDEAWRQSELKGFSKRNEVGGLTVVNRNAHDGLIRAAEDAWVPDGANVTPVKIDVSKFKRVDLSGYAYNDDSGARLAEIANGARSAGYAGLVVRGMQEGLDPRSVAKRPDIHVVWGRGTVRSAFSGDIMFSLSGFDETRLGARGFEEPRGEGATLQTEALVRDVQSRIDAVRDLNAAAAKLQANPEKAAPEAGDTAPRATDPRAYAPEFLAREADVEAELVKVAQRLPKAVRVQIERNIQIGRYELDGYWDRRNNVLAVALDKGVDAANGTMRHEEIHALRHFGLFTDREWGLLTERANNLGIRRDIGLDGLAEYRDMYVPMVAKDMIRARGWNEAAELPWPEIKRTLKLADGDEIAGLQRLGLWDEGRLQSLLDEEAVAELASRRRAGESFGARLDKIIDRIAEFLEATYNALRGLGFDTADAVFRRIETGEVGGRFRQPSDVTLPGGAKVRGIDLMAAIRAYHGSPHDFDRFDLGKIGTGEGNQAFGRGLYFAESMGVAKSYRDALGGQKLKDGTPFDELNPAHWAADAVSRAGGDRAKAAQLIAADMTQDMKLYDGGQYQRLLRAKGMLERNEPVPVIGSGKLYEVNLKAEPEDFLDWDKPLSQQSEKVQKAVRQYMNLADGSKMADLGWNNISGRPINDAIGDVLRADTSGLRDAGIAGVRYLDQQSRGAGDGSRNYVIFDNKNIEIVAKDGQPFERELARADLDAAGAKLVEACKMS